MSLVVLVTGCSTGIGRAIANELHSRGHVVVATARNPASLSDLAAKGIETRRLDVNDAASITRAVEDTLTAHGRIDVLVNNAGVNTFGPLAELPLEHARSIFETNVIGLLAVTQAVFPSMAKRRSGRIVNIGSIVGILPTPFAGVYCASKSAVHMLSEALRMEVAPLGIAVVVVQPGGVKSSIADNGSRDLDRYKEPSSHYHLVYDGIVKRANTSQDDPMPAEDFARELVDQALSDPPPRIIRLGTGVDTIPGLAGLPGEQRDALLSANFGLGALSG